MTPARYAELAQLPLTLEAMHQADVTCRQLSALAPLAPASELAHYCFVVPELGEGGACSLFGQLAEQPYDLRPILGGQNPANDALLADLNAAVAFLSEQNGVDWLGIYRVAVNPDGEQVLVKLAYRGAPSRAEFPLTAAFAQVSNNATVGRSGHGRLINSVPAYVAGGGEYYTCDPQVAAELCIPVYHPDGTVLGIIDAEAFQENFFDARQLGAVVGLALWASARLSIKKAA